jgi:TRAP-type C4-dicarboxylate transport system substrate-binding protein
MNRRTWWILIVAWAGFLSTPLLAASSRPITVKLGTLAPEGTPWHDVLMQVRQDWRDISGGRVDLKVYAGGVLGDEYGMIRKMSFRQLHAVAISGAGLARIEPGVSCMQVPLMFDSYPELDYVLERMAPKLEKMIEAKGYVVLNWGDAGWVHFFTRSPVRTLDEIRSLKLLTSAGDPDTEELYKDFGFRVVPLSYTDVLSSLQTGMIEAVQGPPLFAMTQQWFGLAKNMVDVKWAALIGATVIRRDTWDRIPVEWRDDMMAVAREAGLRTRAEIRKLGDDAIPEMQKRGLNVVDVDEATLAGWLAEAEVAYPKLRGSYVAGDLFDEVKRLRDGYRRRGAGN